MEVLTSNGARFVDGEEMEFDSVIFATGYRTNLPSWLKACIHLLSLAIVHRSSLIHLILVIHFQINGFCLVQDTDLLSAEGKPKNEFLSGCQGGEGGIYFVGFSGKGLLGSSADAIKTALRISEAWKRLSKNKNKDILPL